jgi:hypothetical protein
MIDGIGKSQKPGHNWSEHLLEIRRQVEDIGTHLAWDADWMPVVFVEGIFPADMPGVRPEAIGKEGTLILGLADGFVSEASKDVTSILMMAIARALKAKGMTFLSCVWMSEMPSNWKGIDVDLLPEEEQRKEAYAAARAFGPPSKDPNRKERLMLLSVYYGGPEDGTKIAYADIKREEGKHPQLQNWTLWEEGGTFFGRFPEAIYAGLKMAREAE